MPKVEIDNNTVALLILGIVSIVYIFVYPKNASEIIPVLTGVVGFLSGKSAKNAQSSSETVSK